MFKTSVIMKTFGLLLFSIGLASAYTPAYQGFDGSYVTLGDYNGKTQAITIVVDDTPFHFKLDAELDAAEATENLALSMDELEFAVGYTDKPIQLKGEDYYFEIADLVVLWENEPVKVKNLKVVILPPYNKSQKAKAIAVLNADGIKAYNKNSAVQKYTLHESLIDDAVTSAWNKESRQATKSSSSPSPSAVGPTLTPSKDDELKRKLEAAKAAKMKAKIAPPSVAASNSFNTEPVYPRVQGGPIVTSQHFIADSNTRRIIGFTLLATGVITGLQAVMEHQVQAGHAANVKSYEELINLSYFPDQPNYVTDSHFQRMYESEKAIKSKHETNRNLAAIVSLLSLSGGIIVLNF